jgi:hypothetical protein
MNRPLGTYRPNSNIVTTVSIREEDEQDYLALRRLIKDRRGSIGDYLITAYRELDKTDQQTTYIKQFRRQRYV